MKLEHKMKRVLLVCSAGGHLAQILEMEPLFKKFKYIIVTENIEATRPLQNKYNMRFVNPAGKGRNFEFWMNFIINIIKAISIIMKFNPHVIITTGSHTAVPFCYFGKLLGKKIIYILTFARINTKAKAADIIYPIADEFIVQWESAQKLYPKSKYLGGGIY
jgi:UDP-N-acetylglucosamine:LPS N-acetylglucosamine transferase